MDAPQDNNLGFFLTNTFGDKYLYEVNHNIFNKQGSETLYDSRFDKDFFKENSFFIVVGTDSGLLPNYINKRGVPAGTRFLFIELLEIIDQLPNIIQAETIDPMIDIITVDDLAEKITQLNFNDYVYLNNLFLLEAFCVQDAYLQEYRKLYSIVHQKMETANWEIKSSLGSKNFMLRQLENLPENQLSGSCLKNIFNDKTAVILGGGPSLDNIIPWVKKNRENLVLLAVSRISKRLLDVDLTPDLIFSVDPQLVSFDISRDMLRYWEKSLFVHSFHLCPPLLGQWQGRNVYVGPRLPWKTNPDEAETLCIGPTVTHTALEVAIDMGFSQIILGGVDLCYSQEGYSHAKGSLEYDHGPKLGDMIVSVETNDGEFAGTTAAYNMGITAISEQAAKASTRGCQIINPAASAAKINNVEYIPLKNIHISALAESPDKTIQKNLPETNSTSSIRHYQEMLKEMLHARKKLTEIKKLCKEALAANDGLFGRKGKKANFKYKKQMDKIENKLNSSRYKDFTRVIKGLGAEHFLKMVRPSRAEWTDEEIENAGKTYYNTYRDSTQTLLDLIKQTEARLKARLEEEKNDPDFETMFKQWRDDKQPGRAIIWQHRHTRDTKDLASAVQSTLAEMNSEMELYLTGEKNYTKERFEVNPFNPSEVRAKAAILFKQQNKEGLQKILQGMSKHNHDEIEPLSHLTKAYIAELEDNFITAFAEYEKLFSNDTSPILEEGLKRIATLSLKLEDYSNALTALECLTGISPTYMPNFADLLWMTGDNRKALDIYADYFTKIPDDLVSMLKLGNYYKELNMEEGVRMAANYVLEKNPENKAAKLLLDDL